LHLGGSEAPAIIGLAAFVLVMGGLTYAMLPKKRRSIGWLLGIVALEAAAFTYALLFLLLNIYGS